MLQYGFANYEYYSPSANELNKNIQVYGGEQDVAEISPSTGIHVVVPKAEANTDFKNLDLDFRLEEYLSAPVSAGENAGLVRLNYKGEMIATSAMETKQPVALGSLFKRIKDSIKRML